MLYVRKAKGFIIESTATTKSLACCVTRYTPPRPRLGHLAILTFNELVIPSMNGVFIELRRRVVQSGDLDRRPIVPESFDLFTSEAGPVGLIVVMRPTDGDVAVADDHLL